MRNWYKNDCVYEIENTYTEEDRRFDDIVTTVFVTVAIVLAILLVTAQLYMAFR